MCVCVCVWCIWKSWRWRDGVYVFADWIITCRMLCCYSMLSQQPDAPFDCGSGAEGRRVAPAPVFILAGLRRSIQGLRSHCKKKKELIRVDTHHMDLRRWAVGGLSLVHTSFLDAPFMLPCLCCCGVMTALFARNLMIQALAKQLRFSRLLSALKRLHSFLRR